MKRVLVAYSKAATHVATTREYLLALKKFSKYDVEYVNVTYDAFMDFDINDYDVVFHNYCARLCFSGYVSDSYQTALLKFRGLKVLAVQDDYDHTTVLHQAIRRLGFHVLLTCIQNEVWPLVYPQSELPGVRIVQGLTGYVPERLVETPCATVSLSERKTWVAYRGGYLPPRYGRLAFEKCEIGRRMAELCTARSIPHDIATDAESRIYGDDWFKFLGSSRSVLGSESGSNAFDLDDRLEGAIASVAESNGRPATYHDIKDILDPLEAPFNVGQISPRIFESAAMLTPMILFRGSYSNAIEPGVHYLPLEKDFSNANEVLDCVANLEYLQGFVDRAYQQLVASGKFGYRSLAALLQGVIEEEFPSRIDPQWIAYREKMQRHWRNLGCATDNAERDHLTGFVEHPTECPLSADAFWESRRLSRIAKRMLDSRESVVMPGAVGILVADSGRDTGVHLRAFGLARFGWHILPMRVRRFVIEIQRQAILEREWRNKNQPMGEAAQSAIKTSVSLRLARYIWRTLPQWLRLYIVALHQRALAEQERRAAEQLSGWKQAVRFFTLERVRRVLSDALYASINRLFVRRD